MIHNQVVPLVAAVSVQSEEAGGTVCKIHVGFRSLPVAYSICRFLAMRRLEDSLEVFQQTHCSN